MKFSVDWEKLSWTVFTTIRKNTGTYRLGRIYKIKQPAGIFYAKVIGLLPIKKADITDALAIYDAEQTRKELIQTLEAWYGKKFDDYVLITLWADNSFVPKKLRGS